MSGHFLCTLGENEETQTKGGAMHLSHSSRIDFCKCRRLYYYRKIEGITVRPTMLSPAIKMGIIWDRYIESRYLGLPFKDKFWELVDEYAIEDMEVAKMHGMIQAYRTIGIEPYYETKDGGIFRGCQHKFSIDENKDFTIIGFLDRAYSDHIVEVKMSSRPDFYFQVHNITSQIGTYFLSNPDYKYVVIEAARTPGLRTGAGKYSDEDSDSYSKRVADDIISKPSHYFPGYSSKTGRHGKCYWRNEFPLDELMDDYIKINKDIVRAKEEDAWWKNYMSCYSPFVCNYLPICSTGVCSESIYEVKEPNIIKEEIEEVTE